ncbi:MAG: carboxypeptidase-like regulatory domain-containing protein, partial [Phycisphaerae bacterium]
MLMKRILISLMGLLLPLAMFAQVNVSGTVKDASGVVLPGASIIQKGTTKGAVTDQYGKFNLEVSNESSVIQVLFLGFE